MTRNSLLHLALLVGVTAALLWVPAAAQADPGEGLSVLSSTNAITVNATEGADTAETHLALFNENPTHTRLKVRFEASSNESVKVVSVTPERLPAEEVTRVAIVFEGLESLREPITGELVISGGTDPVAQSVEVKPAPQPTAPWVLLILCVPLFGAIFVALMVVGNMPGDKHAPLRFPAPGAKWEAKSWATTLTAAGALLGTVLGGVTFPSYPEQISKESLVNLNLLFGALVVIGPFLFQTLRKGTVAEKDRKAERFGTNLTLLLTSTVTLWAVFGELAAVALLTWELVSTEWLAAILVFALVLLAFGAARYFFLTMSEAVVRDWGKEEDGAKKRAGKRRKKRQLEAAKAFLVPAGPVRTGPPREREQSFLESAARSAEVQLEHLARDPDVDEEPRPQSFALL